MEQVQIEELVAELETRVDRLRSLYEQYFMGIEKMEPLVPKKDVERRFQTMRREQIRNTALRFRFQMVLQKYNTYQSYWMRIMRQIEDGTYKRDVIRARANLAERRSTRPPPPVVAKPEVAAAAQTKAVSDFPIDIDVDSSEYPNEAPTRKVDIPLTRPKQKSASFTSEFAPFDEATTRQFAATTLSDDEDPTGILPLVGGPPGGAAKPARPAADPEKMRQLAARIKSAGSGGKDEPKKETPPAPTTNVAAPPQAAAPTVAIGVRKPPPLPPRIKPAAGAPAQPPVVPPAPPIAKPAGPPPPTPALAPKAAPPAPRPLPPKAPDPTPERAAPASTAKSAGATDLPENRVRQIYTQYVETKRKQNESTTAITYEGVAKSLRESTARLKEKHGGKSVDFEVTVKDGKTILRPVVKKDAT